MPKIYKVRELMQKLKEYDKQFAFAYRRGKGSERMISHPNINGQPKSCPIPCHGEGDDVKRPYYKQIIRRFNLPEDFF